jgi:hypothetical protein
VSPGVFLACVVVMALGLSSYVWLAVLILRASGVPHRAKWGVLVPPLACWLGVRAGGWPRAASITFVTLVLTYAVLRAVG